MIRYEYTKVLLNDLTKVYTRTMEQWFVARIMIFFFAHDIINFMNLKYPSLYFIINPFMHNVEK